MKKEWFVLHSLTGQENKVQQQILSRAKLQQMEDYIGECVIPTEKVSVKKDGKTRTITRKFFPGYLIAEIALYDESAGADANGKRKVYERVWQFLREVPGLIGFLGGDREHPIPLKRSEVDAILSNKPAGPSEEKLAVKMDFSVGETVKVNDGPFMGLTGVVSLVDPGRGKLKVEVSVFNRKVPVDVEGWQVEKLSGEDLAANPQT